jgi:hypothetical protein
MVKMRRRSGSRQGTPFEEQAKTPRIVHEPEMVTALVEALAELLLEAALPNRSARSGTGGQDDESQDHG